MGRGWLLSFPYVGGHSARRGLSARRASAAAHRILDKASAAHLHPHSAQEGEDIGKREVLSGLLLLALDEQSVEPAFLKLTGRGLTLRFQDHAKAHMFLDLTDVDCAVAIDEERSAPSLSSNDMKFSFKKARSFYSSSQNDLKLLSRAESDSRRRLALGAFYLKLNKEKEVWSQAVIFATSTEQRNLWLESIQTAQEINKGLTRESAFQSFRRKARAVYLSDTFQLGTAFVIFVNFASQAVQSQLEPAEGSRTESVFTNMEVVFITIYMIEIAFNMFATLWTEFVSNGWNFFDLIVTAISVISIYGSWSHAKGIAHLRLLRAFRVLRFLNRMPSLRKITVALYASIPAMLNAMVLTLLVVAMYAVMGVEFFKDGLPDGYFNTFLSSCFTLFQMATGDGWSDIVRDLDDLDVYMTWGVHAYFLSFMILVGMVLMQVVIAVLLEEFSKVSEPRQDEDLDIQRFSLRPYPLVPLIKDLLTYKDEADMATLTQMVWQQICRVYDDAESEQARLCYDQFFSGLKALPIVPPVIFTRDDWKDLVETPGLCDSHGRVRLAGFKLIVAEGMHKIQTEQLNDAIREMKEEKADSHQISLFQAVKGILFQTHLLLHSRSKEEFLRGLETVGDGRPLGTAREQPTESGSDHQSGNQHLEEEPSLGLILAEVRNLGSRLGLLEEDVTQIKGQLRSASSPRKQTMAEKKIAQIAHLHETLSNDVKKSGQDSPLGLGHAERADNSKQALHSPPRQSLADHATATQHRVSPHAPRVAGLEHVGQHRGSHHDPNTTSSGSPLPSALKGWHDLLLSPRPPMLATRPTLARDFNSVDKEKPADVFDREIGSGTLSPGDPTLEHFDGFQARRSNGVHEEGEASSLNPTSPPNRDSGQSLEIRLHQMLGTIPHPDQDQGSGLELL